MAQFTRSEAKTLEEIGFVKLPGTEKLPILKLASPEGGGKFDYWQVRKEKTCSKTTRWNLFLLGDEEDQDVRCHETEGSFGLFLLQVGAWFGRKYEHNETWRFIENKN